MTRNIPGSSNHSTSFGVQINIPIFSGFAPTYRTQAAEMALIGKESDRDNIAQQVALDVVKAHNNLSTSTQNPAYYSGFTEERHWAQAVANGRYTAGVGTFLDLLDAQSKLDDARSQEIQARLNWQIARFTLAQALGLLQPDFLSTSRTPPDHAMNPKVASQSLDCPVTDHRIGWWWLRLYRQANTPKLGERYLTTPVEQGAVAQTVSANGTLNPVKLVSVGTQVSGSVKTLYTDFNARVKENQVLAQLDDSPLRAQLGQSEANLASARATLALAQSNFERINKLFKQEYVSRQEFDQSHQALLAAQSSVAQTSAAVQKDRTNLAYATI